MTAPVASTRNAPPATNLPPDSPSAFAVMVASPPATRVPGLSSWSTCALKAPSGLMEPSACKPAVSAPPFSSRRATMLALPAEDIAWLLMTLAAAFKPSAPPAATVPSLTMSPALCTARFVAACSRPEGWIRTSPLALTVSVPVSAARLPPMFTPTPASVPIRRMLLAYMPPSAATSSATPVPAPAPVRADTSMPS